MVTTRVRRLKLFVFLFFTVCSISFFITASEPESVFKSAEETINRLLAANNEIPGLAVAIVNGDGAVYVKGFGYADLEKKVPVTADTLFELGSCSKAFTALAVLRLEKQGLLDLDKPVSHYLSWFRVRYDNRAYPVTLRQLLHHTSGIPVNTISAIPEGADDAALERTVKKVSGIALNHAPGKTFEYATVNYDVLGLVVQEVSGMPFEDYLAQKVLSPLGLSHTVVGVDRVKPPAVKATGYKTGFFAPRKYDPPVFRGNNPAGYVISNGKDMGRWLQLQLGRLETDLEALIHRSHEPDNSVRPDSARATSYGMGWVVDPYESRLVFHSGLNPNFTAYVILQPQNGAGIAVMANSNSAYTYYIGERLMDVLYGDGEGEAREYVSENNIDKVSSIASYILIFALLAVAAYLVNMVWGIFKGRRGWQKMTAGGVLKLLLFPLLTLPFLYGLYLVPRALADMTWQAALVWGPKSLGTLAVLMLVCLAGTYFASILSSLFPSKNPYMRSIPMVVVLSMLTGGANVAVIFLITSSLYSNIALQHQLYFFGLAMLLYIGGRKIVQTRLLKITYNIVYDMRMNLIKKIFLTSYQRFEKLDSGRVFATLNNDTGQIGNSVNLFVSLLTSIITTTGVFIYLASIAFWATVLTLGVVGGIAGLYSVVSKKAEGYFEASRDTQNVYMRLLRGIIDGFKELSLSYDTRMEYKDDLDESCSRFREKLCIAMIKFVNALLVGESLLIIVLGAVAFVVPRMFPLVTDITLISFIMALLYLIGPINVILSNIPAIMQLRVAWNRVKGFKRDIPANMDPGQLAALKRNPHAAERIEARGIMFRYKANRGRPGPAANPEHEQEPETLFTVGPLDFHADKGEVVFIIGGNGSGKTTLAKLLTGLYLPEEGTISIDGKKTDNYQLGEYFSAVFSDFHLFGKLYNVDLERKEEDSEKYLKLMHLEDKVSFEGNSFSTINLSGGQRKRLALLRCYMEDAPIYLFDEVAADQDPQFRRFFYRELLPKMKEDGKIVIAITHDDHYFDVADRVVKMDMGQIETGVTAVTAP
jgi:cyclic peptide transporter